MNSQVDLSPSQLVWKELKKDKAAMFGLFIVACMILLSSTAYFFIPDKSKNANTMCLQISFQKPGFTCDFLKLKKSYTINESKFSNFVGNENNFQIIAIQNAKLKNDTIFYSLFGDASNSLAENISLDKLETLDVSSKARIENFIFKKYFLLGTDRYGRDLFSRLILGARVSLSVGLIAVIISLIVGIVVGSLAGYYRGKVDTFLLWLINVVWSIPTLLLVLAITLALGKGFAQVFIAVGLTMWVEVARIVRGQFFSLREMQFVEAGKALGYKNFRVIFKHILPNCMGPVVVIAASNFASAILLEAGLSFLGMGAQAPIPSWGMMIKENYSYIVVDAAYLALWPGFAIALMVLSFTLLGNGLRDAFDTKAVK